MSPRYFASRYFDTASGSSFGCIGLLSPWRKSWRNRSRPNSSRTSGATSAAFGARPKAIRRREYRSMPSRTSGLELSSSAKADVPERGVPQTKSRRLLSMGAEPRTAVGSC